jgi:hypothetical protein
LCHGSSTRHLQHQLAASRGLLRDAAIKDAADTAIDLTGWTVAAQAWDKTRTTKHADFAVDYTDRAAGTVKISLTDEQTALLPNEAYYDVLLTDTTGLKEYYLEGILYVSEGYTA